MEEIQYYWKILPDKSKLRIKKLLYINYDFTKKNIDKDIKKNIKKIYSIVDEYKKNISFL